MNQICHSFQDIIFILQQYWRKNNCIILQPLDLEVGAGTFHPGTFLYALGPEPWKAAYIQPCRRPADGRYGENPNRFQYYYQFQVIIKPSIKNIQELYLKSLEKLGINLKLNDIRFVEDNWESPTLGSWGIGWEIWLNGMEITQFTYFQQVGGLECNPITVEITYGLERIAMHIQEKDNINDIVWSDISEKITYGQLFLQNEIEMSKYNFEYANIDFLFNQFNEYELEILKLLDAKLTIPAYEMVLKMSHFFNLLDARGAISVGARQEYILRIRTLAKAIATNYYQIRKNLNFPFLNKFTI